MQRFEASTRGGEKTLILGGAPCHGVVNYVHRTSWEVAQTYESTQVNGEGNRPANTASWENAVEEKHAIQQDGAGLTNMVKA